MRNKSMAKVLANRAKLLEEKQHQAKILQDKIFSIPEISNAQANYINTSFAKLDPKNKISQEDINDKHKAYIEALKKYGYSEEIFHVDYNCNICKDTGFNGDNICKCIKSDFIKQLEKDCNILKTAPFTFKDNNPDLIKNNQQKAQLNKLYKNMKSYISKYPNVSIHTITLSGGTGTGKTALAQATARAMVKKGYSALFISAFEFNEYMLKYHRASIEEKNQIIEDLLTCDMLVIDDLGSEPIIKRITIEYLLLVLEHRLNHKLTTIITSNLNSNFLLFRYHERVYSRLADKRNSLIIEMTGDDLRL